MSIIINLLLFVILLSVIVSLHELGHLISAKIFGVYCKEYAIGMGPKIWSYQGKETEYSIRAFPLGGFVAMAGDENSSLETAVDTTDIPFERTLKGIAKWKQIIVMMSGIMMNILLAVFIYSMVFLADGAYVKGTKPVVVSVLESSPAEVAGLKEGDLIEKITFENGIYLKPSDYIEMISFTSAYDGNGPWILEIERDGKDLTIEVMPEYDESQDRFMVGIGFSNEATELVNVNIFNCFYYGFKYAFFILRITWSSLLTLFQGKNLESVSGPVGIYDTVAQTASLGFFYYIQLMAAISINVGIINAFPLPIFDGGRVVLLIIECIIGKPLSEKASNMIMNISMALLMALLIFVTYNDIVKLIGG